VMIEAPKEFVAVTSDFFSRDMFKAPE
jgi:hypothetical protein